MDEILVYRIGWQTGEGEVLFAAREADGRRLRQQLERAGFGVEGPLDAPGLMADGGSLSILRVYKQGAGTTELSRVLRDDPRVRFLEFQ
jgi:hypothetical protein